jgi:YVTN family beta-propeller protein
VADPIWARPTRAFRIYNEVDMKARLALVLALAACGGSSAPRAPAASSTLAITADDAWLWVVNQDADSVSLIDLHARARVTEVPLTPAPPAPSNDAAMRYEPQAKPRALALLPGDTKLYVAGQTANRVFVIDTKTRAVTTSIPVAADPVGVVAAPDGSAVYAVSHQAASVTKIDPKSDQVVGTLPIGEHPWGASVSGDGKLLYVSHLLLHPGVTVIDTKSFMVRNVVELAEQPPDAVNGKLAPNGVARGVYSAVPRPGSGELWLPHMLLAVKTPEPALDFQSTVFPTISTVDATGMAEGPRFLFKPLAVPGNSGSFNDVISGPRAIAFTPDGRLALLASSGSEDVMVFDAATGDERLLVRPISASFLEGIAVDHAGKWAYVEGRNTHDVVPLKIDPADPIATVAVDGNPIDRLASDPMPQTLRLGQQLFYSANSAAYPVTQNFWMSCSSCHLEGSTDAVTWLFTVGPRDTPSNAGGPINTGFLLRQALRNSVVDYDNTIDIEQGGTFHRSLSAQQPLLDALSAFVNYAIPFPQNPNLAATGLTDAQTRGQTLFQTNCTTCHTGAYLTDSGAGNPTLDLNGPIVLHDIGTCVTAGPFDDQAAPDEVVGKMHTACDFDTPSLRGVFATPPYFHDGSAATLMDVVDRLPFSMGLSASEKADLVSYLQTL